MLNNLTAPIRGANCSMQFFGASVEAIQARSSCRAHGIVYPARHPQRKRARQFSLTPLGEALKSDAPGGARSSVLTIASDWWFRGFGELAACSSPRWYSRPPIRHIPVRCSM
jgi:hypothetical protein